MAEKSERIVAQRRFPGAYANMTLYLAKPILLDKARKTSTWHPRTGTLPPLAS